MLGLDALARQHRDIFYGLIEETGQTIVIRKELPAQTSGITPVSRVLGVQVTQSTAAYPEVEVRAIVTGPSAVKPLSGKDPGPVAPVGLLQSSDIVLRVKLLDVIVDEDNIYGPTLFDVAHDVRIGENIFKVVAVERSGLPPLSPYICWCGLRSAGKP